MFRSIRVNRQYPRLKRSISNVCSDLFKVKECVQSALRNSQPVVALESTIVAHGMPYPENLELAQDVESILLDKGVIPATIAIKDGICRVGLETDELEDLAKAGQEGRAKKCSTRDIPVIMASTSHLSTTNQGVHQWGATTVASTMKLAHLAGISTFVTGGIGGVHRAGEVTMDISADLTELSRTPVVVVSAGIKSILDIERTLEVLETNSVPTFGWKTDEFPAFFSPKSGVRCPARADGANQIASTYWAARGLHMDQGMLVAVPNNDPAGANVENAIQAALVAADEKSINGQEVTPFILKRVAEKTSGESLRSNIALVKQNAEVGASIAIAIAGSDKSIKAGGNESSNATNMVSPTDEFGQSSGNNLAILRRTHDLRMSSASPDQPIRDEILEHAKLLVMDGGVEVVTKIDTARKAVQNNVDIVFIPSGVRCAMEAFKEKRLLQCVKYAIADVEELLAMSDGWSDSTEDIQCALNDPDFKAVKIATTQTLRNMHESEAHILVTLEDKGLLLASRFGDEDVIFNRFHRKNDVEIYKGTAASDCLCGAFLHQLLDGEDVFSASSKGFDAVHELYLLGQSATPMLSHFEART